MNSERAALAKSLLAKKAGSKNEGLKPLPVAKHKPPRLSQPNYSKYSNIHPEVLGHVQRYLEEFRKGLGK